MAKDSVSKYLDLMNHQVGSQERLSEFLAEVIAMLEVALSGDLSAFEASTLHYYLLAVSDIVIRSRTFNEQLLNNWNWIIKHLITQEPEPPSGETVH